MPKRSSKRKDLNQLAASIVEAVTHENDREKVRHNQSDSPPVPSTDTPQKNPAAVELGRLGGLKGGKARAAKLSAKRRREIARNAARARWTKKMMT